jgi:hypothetical protein
MKLPTLLTLSTIAWIGAAAPAAAQLNIGVNLGGTSVGVEVGAGGVGVEVGTGGASVSVGTPAAPDGPLPQDAALEAVRAARALPLDEIIARANLFYGVQVIDARLITLRGFLLYELKVLEPTGDVVELYFYARSGEPVRAQ